MHELIELLVLDAHPAMRGALRASLEFEDGIRVVGEAGDMFAALRLATDGRVTAALVDTPAGPAAVAARPRRSAGARASCPGGGHGHGRPGAYAASYLAAGASGYWTKDGDLARWWLCYRRRSIGVRPPSVTPSSGAGGDPCSSRMFGRAPLDRDPGGDGRARAGPRVEAQLAVDQRDSLAHADQPEPLAGASVCRNVQGSVPLSPARTIMRAAPLSAGHRDHAGLPPVTRLPGRPEASCGSPARDRRAN